ncbi:peroxide stress protein YaaA [Snodgrassella alvi]|jgi:uncharacterized protein|uniref:peroxide stress protein YaaA n=1 Tax=Snodgrassella alvi TaxID=1196083 RepID=UPI000C1EF621|nr:peroxide stress protein YaaA [Snodgrassella alvi]PIT10035.1 hypothetical protein BGI30_07210 [Snodgrassella alvi]PIT43140.1 hypothetical protein BHC51_11770 [Snodgrassella alvi]PIT57299.1 hypothetical protein BHC59_05220 [Snodgrassella alvi]
MYFVISPAKKLNETVGITTKHYTQPQLLQQAQQLMPLLQQLAPHEIATLMSISDKLALQNAERYHHWLPPFTPDNAKQAVYLFNGDVYEGLDASHLSEPELNYMQQHLAILSGLYGVLKPLDLIQPYRLEMGIKLANPRGKDLYAFWGDIITNTIEQNMQAVQDQVLINLASQEYFKVIKPSKLSASIITPVFKDQKNGEYKIISFYAKRARGLFMRYAAEKQLTEPEELKDFDYEGYYYDKASSSDKQWIFLRDENTHH